jgi:hypothetical protein
MAFPRLFDDLRTALACLYSLSHDAARKMDSREAHDFLLYMQSRNVRRKLHSLRQSDRDQQKSCEKSSSEPQPKQAQLSDERQGSTWLSCLALLCSSDADSAERLFAAQTMMHRLRRTKLSEAIDLEMEEPSTLLTPSLDVNLPQLAAEYVQWMRHFHPLLESLVQHFLTDPRFGDEVDEDQLKGEISMLTLSAITYLTACSGHSDPNLEPLIYTLGSSLASIALRLRFTPRSIMTQTKATAASAPLVTMVVRSLSTAAATDSTNNIITQTAIYSCLCSCLSAIPDTLLATAGGALGRFSVDPHCVQAAHEELRQPSTGVHLLWEALCHTMPSNDQPVSLQEKMLITCQKWAKWLPLPHDFVEHTVPLAGQHLSSPNTNPAAQKAALSYLIVIYESGAWTAPYILSFSLGLSSDQLAVAAANKKRQSSRSKRRQKEKLESTATDTLRVKAEVECHHRGETACRTTRLVWERLAAAARQALEHHSGPNVEGGEGPVGCLCACANVCLPHWLKNPSLQEAFQPLAQAIMDAFQEVCSNGDRTVRALSYEPLYTLNTALMASARDRVSTQQPPTDTEVNVADHLFHCAMRLATSCAYPSDYFDFLDRDNDEEIEMERNEVRDLIRAISGGEDLQSDGDDTNMGLPMDVSMRILDKMVRSCANACSANPSMPPETAVHALSALAKPMNSMAEAYTKRCRSEGLSETLMVAIQALGNVHKSLVVAFGTPSMTGLFPVSRLANLATASYAPVFSAICELRECLGHCDPGLMQSVSETVDAAVHSAALAIVHIPELAAESTLDHTQYDIRGAMRGPGGEDHVGCLALTRLAFESDALARAMMAANDSSGPFLPLELCKLHDKLKSVEDERGPGVCHGTGIAPKSRRILLQTLCRIVLLHRGDSTSSGGSQDALSALNELFWSLISSVAVLTTPPTGIDANRMHRIVEAVLDLAAFSPDMVCSIFDDSRSDETQSVRHQFLHGLFGAGQLGYTGLSAPFPPDDLIHQWGRLRASLSAFVRASACPDIPGTAADAIILLNKAECQAISFQCALGPTTASRIFSESVISESSGPSGLFVRIIGETIQQNQDLLSARNCVLVLYQLRTVVLDTLLSKCPEPTNPCFVDPRPTLCEAWYLTLDELMESFNAQNAAACNDASIKSILSDSCCTALLLLLYPSLRKDPNDGLKDIGMTLDGPQTRAIMEFLESYFLLGPDMFRAVALTLSSQLVAENVLVVSDDPVGQGVAIVGACLFRAASGALPPWAIEVIPSLYAALYHACGTDVQVFRQMLITSMQIRLVTTTGFGGVYPGELLAGRFFESAKDSSKRTFVERSQEACSQNDAEGWRRFKVLLKQACGGKKKASLSLKPSFTTWNIDRI